MKQKILPILCAIVILCTSAGISTIEVVTAAPLACSEAYCYHFPLILVPARSLYFPMIYNSVPITESAIIINHDNIDINQIPDEWLVAARALTIHYGQTSHGSQILSGLGYLETYVDGTKYNYAISPGGTPPSLPAGTDLMKIYTGNNYSGNTYITPDMYWDGTNWYQPHHFHCYNRIVRLLYVVVVRSSGYIRRKLYQ